MGGEKKGTSSEEKAQSRDEEFERKREGGTERVSVREGGWRVTEGREGWRDGGRKRSRRDGKEGWVRRGRDGCGGWGRDGRRDGRRNVTDGSCLARAGREQRGWHHRVREHTQTHTHTHTHTQ